MKKIKKKVVNIRTTKIPCGLHVLLNTVIINKLTEVVKLVHNLY